MGESTTCGHSPTASSATGSPGSLDVPWLLAELRARGRDPNAILELWPPEADVAAAVAKEESWAAEGVRYLRRFIPD
jgi:hypothetical protein